MFDTHIFSLLDYLNNFKIRDYWPTMPFLLWENAYLSKQLSCSTNSHYLKMCFEFIMVIWIENSLFIKDTYLLPPKSLLYLSKRQNRLRIKINLHYKIWEIWTIPPHYDGTNCRIQISEYHWEAHSRNDQRYKYLTPLPKIHPSSNLFLGIKKINLLLQQEEGMAKTHIADPLPNQKGLQCQPG